MTVGLLCFAGAPTEIWIVYAVVLLQGAAMQFFVPAEQTLIATAVSTHDLPAAAGANSAATNVTRLVAPALGGGLMSLAGFTITTGIIVGMLSLAALLLSGLAPTAHTGETRDSDLFADWREGLLELRINRTARAIATLQTLDAFKEGALSALFPVLMLGVIGTTPAFMGIVNSSFAVTALLAGPSVAFVVTRLGYRSPIAAGATASGLLLVTLIVVPTQNVALLTFFLAGFPFTISWVACGTLLLLSTPHSRRARSLGTLGSTYAATMLISATAAGLAAETVGPIPVLLFAAGLQVIAGPVFLVMTRALHLIDTS
jgi:MFS family permease